VAEVTYSSVTWTAGDTLTEAKMDAETANDRAVDAMNNGVEFTERAAPSTPGANKVHVYAKDKAGASTVYIIDDAGTDIVVAENQPNFVFPVAGGLFTGTSKSPILIATRTLTIVKAYANVKTAPTGANLICDINKNGTSIWNATQANRITVVAAATSGTQTSFDTVALAEGDILTMDVDQVGSTIAGADLTVTLRCKV
jgi:hypothetical protein